MLVLKLSSRTLCWPLPVVMLFPGGSSDAAASRGCDFVSSNGLSSLPSSLSPSPYRNITNHTVNFKQLYLSVKFNSNISVTVVLLWYLQIQS